MSTHNPDPKQDQITPLLSKISDALIDCEAPHTADKPALSAKIENLELKMFQLKDDFKEGVGQLNKLDKLDQCLNNLTADFGWRITRVKKNLGGRIRCVEQRAEENFERDIDCTRGRLEWRVNHERKNLTWRIDQVNECIERAGENFERGIDYARERLEWRLDHKTKRWFWGIDHVYKRIEHIEEKFEWRVNREKEHIEWCINREAESRTWRIENINERTDLAAVFASAVQSDSDG